VRAFATWIPSSPLRGGTHRRIARDLAERVRLSMIEELEKLRRERGSGNGIARSPYSKSITISWVRAADTLTPLDILQFAFSVERDTIACVADST